MTFMMDKDTKICGSFAKVAGSTGCLVHNSAFRHLGLNYIYKSFSVTDIKAAMESMRVLNFTGAAVTMPYKVDAIEYLDDIDPLSKKIGVINTILHKNGKLIGYNTDYFAVRELFSKLSRGRKAYILGKGGMAKTARHALGDLGFENLEFITRNDWPKIPKIERSIVINCTPEEVVPHSSNEFIDCRVASVTGKEIALSQASLQFELYTGCKFPLERIKKLSYFREI